MCNIIRKHIWQGTNKHVKPKVIIHAVSATSTTVVSKRASSLLQLAVMIVQNVVKVI